MGIRVVGLTKAFPNVIAVNGVSFECKGGEIFGLLGPNGAGKTTTIRLILDILEPSSGEIYVNGTDISKDPVSSRSKIGAVLEDNGVYERLTAEENVLVFAEYFGVPEDELRTRVEEIFSLLEIGSFRKRLGKELSKGMSQKVQVARALISDPPILILDEPTEGLDVPTRRAIIELMKRERKRGKCILYSTHVMSEAEEVCDRVGIIFQGRLHFVGKLEELKKRTESTNLEEAFMRVVKDSFSEEGLL